jgi:hypothetical protein
VMGHGEAAPASSTIPVHLLERASCAPPRSTSQGFDIRTVEIA